MNETAQRKVFQSSDCVWLCLTTLYHRRFIEDAVNLVGMPAGSPLRLRYDRRYVSKEVWDAAQNQKEQGAYVLVALAATDVTGAERIDPLRRARLTRAQCEGSLLVLDIALEDLIYSVVDTGAFRDELRILARDLPETFRARGAGIFVQRLPQAPQAILGGSGVAAWERVVESFFEIEKMSRPAGLEAARVPFLFYISGFSSSVEKRLISTRQLDVEAASSVRFDIHTAVPPTAIAIHNPLGEVVCELAHSSATFVSSRRARVDSRRDVRRIEFRTTTLFRRHYGHLSVRTVYFQYSNLPENANGSTAKLDVVGARDRIEIVASRYDFPLAVGRWLPWFASLMSAGGALLAAYKLPKDSSWELWRLLAVFTLAVTGVFLGLRKEAKAD